MYDGAAVRQYSNTKPVSTLNMFMSATSSRIKPHLPITPSETPAERKTTHCYTVSTADNMIIGFFIHKNGYLLELYTVPKAV
jgi:hypothetical protein